MEIDSKISQFIKVDSDGFVKFIGTNYRKQIRPHFQQKGLLLLSKIIDNLGQRSASAQKLKQVITNTTRFFGTDQRIYIKVLDNKVLGFIKVGEKKLFYHNNIGKIIEITPTSVLDFYVHQTCQRSGLGKEIFDKFLKAQGKSPQKLAYDRPSEKLIGFLKKHFNLSSFKPQNNNYVIFDKFFVKEQTKSQQSQKKLENQLMNQNIDLNKVKSNIQIKRQKQPKINEKQVESAYERPTSFKATKDQSRSTFGCPWAIQEKVTFKTTSNNYGKHYNNR